MISIKNIWDRVNDYGKKHQSGQDTVSEFNGKVNEAQIELMNMVLPFFETNDRVKELLDPFIIPYEGSTDTTGRIDKPDGYFKNISLSVLGYGNPIPSYPVQMNEIHVLYDIPQREPSLDKRNVYHHTAGVEIRMYPSMQLDYEGYYLKEPEESKLVFTYEEDALSGELVQTVDENDTVDLDWNMDAFNLLVYLVLNKYGVSNREMILSDVAKLGLKEVVFAKSGNVQEV